jgi:hypothetical protein
VEGLRMKQKDCQYGLSLGWETNVGLPKNEAGTRATRPQRVMVS